MDQESDGLQMVIEGPQGTGGTVRIRLGGTFDIGAQGAVRRGMLSLLGGRPKEIEIDLERVTVLESDCAAYLAREQLACEAIGVALRLRAPQPDARELLRFAGARVDVAT
jgi:anti-anti-sigma regulatory factor